MTLSRARVRLLTVALVISGCSAPEHGSPPGPLPLERTETQEKQIETLESIAALEAEATRLAESHNDVRSARIYIRSGSAIVLLTAEVGTKIQPETIEAVNAYLAERAGLNRDQIVIKQVDARGESR